MLKIISYALFILATTLKLYAVDAAADPSLLIEDASSADRRHSVNIVRLSPENREWASDAKFLLVDGSSFDTYETSKATQVVAKQTIDKGNSVALTLSHVDKFGAQINSFTRDYASVLILSAKAAQTLTNASDPFTPAQIFRNMKKKGAIICGSKGAYVFDETGICGIKDETGICGITNSHIPTVAQPADITGTFSIGFLEGLIQGESVETAGQIGFSYRTA